MSWRRDQAVRTLVWTLTREQLGTAAGITATAGTFSTYLGELRRNGLITVENGHIRATDILIHGADPA